MHTAISVVIPTFNSAKHLTQTLESVAAQTHPPAEIVLADGGSTDETLSIGSKFGVKISSERSRSIPSGRNIGMREASHEWIGFLDHDDLWMPTKLEQQVAALNQFPDSTMVLTDYIVFSDQSRDRPASNASQVYRKAIDAQGSCYFPAVDFTDREWIVPLTSSAMVRKGTEWFDEDLQGTDDVEFFLRMMTRPFVLLDAPLTMWRWNSDSYSQKDPIVMDLDFAVTMQKVMDSPARYPRGVHECVSRIRRARLRQTARKLLKGGRVRESLSLLRSSFSGPRHK